MKTKRRRASTAPEPTEIPCCGYRPSAMPPGYETIHEGQGEAVTPRELIRQFAAWVEEADRRGAIVFMAKAIAIGQDGKPV